MRTFKRLRGAMAAISVIALVTSCSSATSDGSSATAPSQPQSAVPEPTGGAAPSLQSESQSGEHGDGLSPQDALAAAIDDVRERAVEVFGTDKFVVGYSDDYVPFSGVPADGDQSNPEGLAVEITNALADVLGVEVQYEATIMSQKIAGVQSGKYDMGIGGSYDTKERQEVMDLVDFMQEGSQLLVAKGNPLQLTPDDYCGRTIASTAGTTFGTVDLPKASEECVAAGEDEIEILTFPTHAETLASVQSGRSDGEVLGQVVNAYNVKQSPDKFELSGEPYNKLTIAKFVKRGSEIAPLVRDAMQIILQNGTYGTILDSYGVSSAAIDCVTINLDQATCQVF